MEEARSQATSHARQGVGRPIIALAAVVLVIFVGHVQASGVQAAPPPLGGLTQLSGTEGCVSETGTGGICTDGTALEDVTAVAVTPNGEHLYAVSEGSDSVVAFTRDARGGAIAQLTGTDGCISDDGSGGLCTNGSDLDGANSLAVSPDGKHLYVASLFSNAIAPFVRDASTGKLAQLAGSSTVQGPAALAVSPDGKHLYAASLTDNGIWIFARDAATGALAPLAGADGCITDTGNGGACTDGEGLLSPRAVTISPDGKHVYTASDASDAVAAFARDESTGKLAQLVGTDGCISETGTGGACVDGKALDGARSVVVSADNKHVYVASSLSDAVAVFSRSASSGKLTQLAGSDGCVSETGSGGACTNGKALDNVRALAVSPNTESVYAASGSDGLAVFVRDDQAGKLIQLPGTDGCISEDGSGGACTDGTGLDGAASAVVSPKGTNVYVASRTPADAIAAFGRELPPVCSDLTRNVGHNDSVSIALECSDPNGDALTLSIDTQPANGKVGPIDQKNHTVTYTPNAGFSGRDSFQYKASDGSEESKPATLTIEVASPSAPAQTFRCKGQVATIVGSNGPDVITGTSGADVIVARGGNDIVRARGGDDLICLGSGNDRGIGGQGNDRIYGQSGNDTLFGRAGPDSLFGGPGRDRLSGGNGADRLFGGRGADRIFGGRDDDRLLGSGGADFLRAGAGADTLNGGGGADRLEGKAGNDTLVGGRGRDLLLGQLGDDLLRAGDGNRDVVSGGQGFDRATVDRGLDRVRRVELLI